MNIGRKKIRFLLLFVVLVTLAAIFFATKTTLEITGRNAFEQLGHARQLVAEAAAGSLEDFLSVRLEDLLRAAEDLKAQGGEESEKILQEILDRGDGFFSAVSLIQESGHLDCVYPRDSAGGKAAAEIWHRQGLEGPDGELKLEVLETGEMIAWTRAGGPGKQAVLAASLSKQYIEQAYLKELGRRLDQGVYLFDQDWSLLAHQQPRDGSPSKRKEHAFYSRFFSYPEIQVDGFIPFGRLAQLQGEGPSQDRYLAYAPVRLAGKHLFLGLDVAKESVGGYFLRNPLTIIILACSRAMAVLVCLALFYLFDKRRLKAKEEARQLREEQKLLMRLEESEERYKTLVENLQSIVVIFQDGHIKFVNQMFASITGYSEEEATGGQFDLLSLIHETDRSLVAKNIRRALDGEKLDFPHEIKYVKKTGEIITGLTLSGVINFNGRRAIETVVVDITRLKAIEQELRETKGSLQYLLDNAPIMIFSLDPDGNFSYANKETLRVSGYGNDWIGKSFAPIVHPDDLALAVSKFEEGRRGVPRRDYKLRIRNPGGETRILHLVADTISQEQQFKGSLIIGSDITEQQRLQQAIKETRDHLANIIENAGDAIITVDAIGNIVSWNKAAEGMFHFVQPYAFRKPLHLLLNANSKVVGGLIERVLGGETLRDIEIECLRNESRLDTLITLSPIRNASGKVIGMSCFAKDITERRYLETQLKRDKQFIDQLIENANALIATVNEKGKLVIFNRRFEEMTGYQKEHVLGRDPLELLVPQEYRQPLATKFSRMRTDAPLLEEDVPILTKDGRMLNVTWNAASVNLPSGRAGIVVVGQDVTFQRRMQEELMQSKKLASIGELVSGVAHELNNPLTIIMGYSQLLVCEQALGEKHRDMIQKILDAAGRSKRIVDNLLAFARKKKLEKQEVNINEIIERTLSLREHNLAVNDVTLIKRYAEQIPPLYGDYHQLQQVFLNLINNAFDAMFEANRRGVLEVKTVRRDNMIIVEVIDDGPGVPESIQDKIFDPFFTTKEVGKGTGLGMSLSYGIVKEHGGRIYLDRTYSSGAKFVVEFPLNEHSPVPLPADVLHM